MVWGIIVVDNGTVVVVTILITKGSTSLPASLSLYMYTDGLYYSIAVILCVCVYGKI